VVGDVPPGPQVRGTSHELQELLHLRVREVKRDAYGSGPVLRQHFQERYPVDAALSDQGDVRGRVHVVLVLQQEGMRAIEDRSAFLEISTRAGLVVLKTRARYVRYVRALREMNDRTHWRRALALVAAKQAFPQQIAVHLEEDAVQLAEVVGVSVANVLFPRRVPVEDLKSTGGQSIDRSIDRPRLVRG